MRPRSTASPLLLAALAAVTMTGPGRADDPAATPKRRVESLDAARLPAPGTSVPTAIGFTPDGRSVTYLHSESNSLDRVLWRVEVDPKARPRVVARPPGAGDAEGAVSKEEELRRERQRLRDTGITQVARASDADAIVAPIGGDLFLSRPGEDMRRLTETPAPEIDPKPSPDGMRVAFGGEGELRMLDVESGRIADLTSGGNGNVTRGQAEFIAQEELGRQTGFWWSPDGSKIAYQETDERRVPPYTIAHQGGEAYSTETHRYPFAGAENASVRLGIVSATGGSTNWLNLAEPGEDFYLARVDWDGPGSLLVQVLSRDQKTLRLLRFDATTGEKTPVLEEKSSTYLNLHDDLKPLAKTGEFLWSSERTGFRHLELRDRSGALVRTLTSGAWPVDTVAAVDEARREAWFTAGREDALEANLYRVSLDGGPIERLTPEPGTHRVVVAPGGEHFVDTHSDPRTPPRTTIRDRSGKVVLTLADGSDDPRVAALDLPPPQITEFKSRDGVTLRGAYFAPRGVKPGEKRPLVVMVYGGPHVQVVTSSWNVTADMTAQLLASRGFAVWQADNRGSSRRGHAFESALFKEMGGVEVRDQEDGVKFVAASHDEVDPSRVGVTGRSYGGYMTLRCLMLAPQVFRAGVAVAPVTDWDGYDTAYTERYMETPKANPDGYRGSSALHGADRIRGDLLIIHGMLDENVHFRHSARLASALIAADRPFELLPMPTERHSSRKVPERKFAAEKMADFFARTLGR